MQHRRQQRKPSSSMRSKKSKRKRRAAHCTCNCHRRTKLVWPDMLETKAMSPKVASSAKVSLVDSVKKR